MDEQKQHPLPDDFLEQVYRVREQVIQDSKGEIFEDSAELIRQEREKRTKQLMQAVTGQNDEEKESTITEQTALDEANTPRQRRPATRRMAEELRQIREEIMKDRNGKLFEDSAELIRREREKRTEHLMQVISGQYGKDPYEEDTSEEQS